VTGSSAQKRYFVYNNLSLNSNLTSQPLEFRTYTYLRDTHFLYNKTIKQYDNIIVSLYYVVVINEL